MWSILREILYAPLNLLYALVNFIRSLFSSPGELLRSGRRVSGLSLPARVAFLTALVLVLCVAIEVVVFYYRKDRPFFQALVRQPYYLPGIALLLVLIPIVVYYAMKLWLEGDVSPFEDIDRAWHAGLDELDRHGLNIAQIPLFLILGTSGEEQEQALLSAAKLSLNIKGIPAGPAALHWYANPEGIYLVASNASALSRLAAKNASAASAPAAYRPAPVAAAGPVSPTGTIVAEPGQSLYDAVAPSPGQSGDAVPPAISGAAAAGFDPRQTLMPGDVEAATAPAVMQRVLPGAAPGRAVVLGPDEAIEQDRRLAYLCHLVRRARQPVCPFNGILTLLPFAVLLRGPKEREALQRCVRQDLATVLRVGQVRCPVTALVTGMEEEPGFREMARRMGREHATRRFGKGFSVTNFPLAERLEALSAHACGAFEDWVYTLFKERDALSKPRNTQLYALLCKIRQIQAPLANILAAGFGVDDEQDPHAEPLFFSGCYFVGTGATEDRQFFVKDVFAKLPEEQAELQWTTAALREERKYQALANAIIAADFLLALGVVASLAYHIWVKR